MVVIMEFRKYKDRNKRKLYMLIIISFLLISFGNYLFYKSYALYEEIKNFDVINGSVEDPGDIYFAYYIDGEISREMPIQNTGYTFDNDKSSCTNGVKIIWNHSTWQGITDYTNYSATSNTRTKCTLYFNKTTKTISTILGNIEVNSYTPDFTKSACDDETCESHEKGIYKTTDYDGNPTYYYRGSVENNYVKFAGFYWRIIRINSNGSLRLIYDGKTAHSNGEISEDKQYGNSQFNIANDDNMYVGYMYTKSEIHGTSISSVVKNNVDIFYKDNLANYTSKIDQSIGYCGDRSPLNYNSESGINKTSTYYKGYLRVVESTPSLVCEDMSDYYTTSNSNNGNKALIYPIALISVDELMISGLGGGIFNGTNNHQKENNKTYTFSGYSYWTMTPAGGYYPEGYNSWLAYAFRMMSSQEASVLEKNNSIDDGAVSLERGLRPVINIRSDVTITGSGTMTNPYVVN